MEAEKANWNILCGALSVRVGVIDIYQFIRPDTVMQHDLRTTNHGQ